jgi:hypothetical protein
MTRKTGVLVLYALALSVACLGVLLALRCERGDPADTPAAARVETLTVGSP